MNLSRADYELAVAERYASLDLKVMKGWPAAKEAAWKALLAACDYGTADGAPPDDVLDYSDEAWSRAEALVEDRATPETPSVVVALHRFRKECV